MTRALFLAALAGSLTLGTLSADTWNKKTKVTFSQPFQIPGPNTEARVVTLPAGTYVFKLLDSSSNRHIVEVTNTRENKVYSTILAIPDYRVNATSKTVMYFSERKAGVPMAVKSWFYPGDNYGQRFVYPKVKAQELAAVLNEPVPSHTVEVIEKTNYVAVPVMIQTPAKAESAYDANALAKTDADDSHGVDGEAVKAADAAPLPKTASNLPLLGVLGLLLLGASLLVRRASAQLR
jgi:LPXTG-motif cell wall-anchored protein